MLEVFRSKYFRLSLVTIIIISTFIIFGWYLYAHPDVINTLFHLSPWMLVSLTIAYALTIIANSLILHFSLSYLKRSTPLSDNILLTGYSAIINFFGPLQSGPGFRAAYLKKKYGVEIRRFVIATLIFYLFFGFINIIVVLLAAIVELPQWRGVILAAVIFCLLLIIPSTIVIRRTALGKSFFDNARFRDRNFWLIGLGACLLTVTTAAVYAIEIFHIAAAANIWQVIIYTAAANLSLYVSLTPGAIGFREAFLVFSEHLHKLSLDVIAATSVIDRAFYVVFLLVMFIFLLLLGARKRFKLGRNPAGKS